METFEIKINNVVLPERRTMREAIDKCREMAIGGKMAILSIMSNAGWCKVGVYGPDPLGRREQTYRDAAGNECKQMIDVCISEPRI